VTPDLDAWDAWHPRVVAERLAGVRTPWYVAAGWALDLFRGAPSRVHADLEIAVPADRFVEIAARFTDCDFYVAGAGQVVPVGPAAMRAHHQTWALERATGRWRLDVFREPHDGDVWICRRDERIRRPYAEIVELGPDGIPYLAPEIVLLFKAKGDREKDRADLHGVLPLLDAGRRAWLADALALVHPGHPWQAVVAPSRP
jgi:Aminoglycoside-2''-adenylyltransferase